MNKARVPSDLDWQCPLCGTPVDTVAVVTLAHSGERGVDFECCGNVVTFAAMRDAFGIDLPDPDPLKVTHPHS